MKVLDPVIELLAIKLYEHDHQGRWPPPPTGVAGTAWLALREEDREGYRELARGERDLPFGRP